MPLICYVPKRFHPATLKTIEQANSIIAEYWKKGFDLTLRQLYYQFVSRDLIRNTQEEYKKLGNIINDARLAGLIDWNAITDRTRNLASLPHWDSPESIIQACAQQFRIDKWAEQEYYVECFVEKEALAGVVEHACNPLDVPFFSCRGYTSQSEMWVAGQRLEGKIDEGKTPIIIHLGDHDPSGIDMTRDIIDRLSLFMGGVEVKRIALNIDQVYKYRPPPNPAKMTDTRFASYAERFGESCWELDALDPSLLSQLITDTILEYRDEDIWDKSVTVENEHKENISKVASNWKKVVQSLK